MESQGSGGRKEESARVDGADSRAPFGNIFAKHKVWWLALVVICLAFRIVFLPASAPRQGFYAIGGAIGLLVGGVFMAGLSWLFWGAVSRPLTTVQFMSTTSVAIAVMMVAQLVGIANHRGAAPNAVPSRPPINPTTHKPSQADEDAALVASIAIGRAEEAYTFSTLRNNSSVIQERLQALSGDLRIIGWQATDFGQGTYLVSYTFQQNGQTNGWYFDVNTTAGIVRGVQGDPVLQRKYGLANVDPSAEASR